MTIGLVTDSTCDLPETLVRQHGIVVLPLYINLGTESYLDGVEISREQFYRALPHYSTPPKTAAPSPKVFLKTYERLVTEGATAILSIHISVELSRTVESARLAAQHFQEAPVTVLDAQQLTIGTGFAVLKAAEAAAAGHTVDEILPLLEDQIARTYVFASASTFEFLRRSGRVSLVQFTFGTLLRFKPLLTMHRGEAKADAVLTRKRSLRHLMELVSDLAPLERLAIVHINAQKEADALAQQVQHLHPEGAIPYTVPVTPVIGAHVGPGTVGIACVAQ